MKNWKQGFIGIVAIIVLAFAFTACKDEPEPTHTHDWGNWTVTTPSTCTTAGVETRVCKLDGTEETRPIAIDPNAHQWGEWTQTTAPTYDTDGEETRICAYNSDHKETRPIAKLVAPSPIASFYYGEIEILPNETINAGEVLITQSKSITVIIKNTGTADLSLDTANISITGTDASNFNRTTSPASNISAGSQTQFVINFVPTKQGEHNAVLSIPTNDPNIHPEPTVIYLKGTGVETPEERSQPITFDFAGNATVTGELLQAEWDAVLAQLPRIMNERYAAAPAGGAVQGRYDFVFGQPNVTITVEKTDDYENWKTGADGQTLHLNFNAIDNWSSIINAAVRALDEFNATQA